MMLVSRSQTFRLTAEGLECMVAFIGRGRLSDMSNNQSQLFSVSVTFRGVEMSPQKQTSV